MQARVVRDYRTQYENPIRFAKGEIVTLGERDTEWPAGERFSPVARASCSSLSPRAGRGWPKVG
ncbi:MAG: hypothetical protein IT473_13745 [Lysobacter sp.]|nr:hypothetical protein [Lysobacter sp.]